MTAISHTLAMKSTTQNDLVIPDPPRALVTGAGGVGIGRAVARSLAAGGAAVAIHYRKSKQTAERLADELRRTGAQVCLVQGDLADAAGPEDIIGQVVRQLGGLDILINSAGSWLRQPLLDTSLEEWDYLMQSDARAAFLTIRAAAQLMRERCWGRVVNISSVASFRYLEGEGTYGVAKAAINMLTRSFAVELAPFGITVNAVAPGLTVGADQPMPPSPEDYPECGESPDKRPAHACEVASLVSYLCSPSAAHLTGQIIAMDGGLSAKGVKAH